MILVLSSPPSGPSIFCDKKTSSDDVAMESRMFACCGKHEAFFGVKDLRVSISEMVVVIRQRIFGENETRYVIFPP